MEVDETFIGHDKTIKPKGQNKGRGFYHKTKSCRWVDRDSGQARSYVVDDVKAKTLAAIVRANIRKEAHLMTDESSADTLVGLEFADHGVVAHMAGEYGRGGVHTNTIEGFFSIFKRGMKGVCGHNHLHRYMAEYDFRYNNRIALGIDDECRAYNLLPGVVGKRLTYQTTR